MRVLFVGDIYGEPGVSFFLEKLPYLRQTYQPQLVIVNAENAANGRGLTKSIYKRLMASGVALITMGNHTWKNEELKTFIEDARIIRPINDGSNLGQGYYLLNYNGKHLLVINALGKALMDKEYAPPYHLIKRVIDEVPHDYAILDFHAEATSEKIAVAHFFDGQIDAVVGTHTHVQTNDDRILPKGTLYLSDVGMTGPLNGVIGVEAQVIIDRFIHGLTNKNIVAKGLRQLNAVLIALEPKKRIEKIHIEE